ncbi:MAG: ACT domain-containing protein, partial [Thermoleophilia bacterium]|nr:ACT domain-containing protein [Thermoleophilia bacterium]
ARGKLGGDELSGKTLAVLGLGRIGQAVAERARALGMHVVGYDPFVSRERFARLGVEYRETVEEALADGEFTTLHLPLNDDTRGLISTDQLALMPKGARLINCARGALVDLDALDAALETGHIGGAGLDVYPTEPPAPHPAFQRTNVVLTPHLAASTGEAQDRAGIAVAEQVIAALTGGSVTTAVNIPAIAAESVAALQPFAPLAGKLARLAAQLAGRPASLVTVRARGEIAEYDVRMLGYGVLIAMLSGSTDGPVTFVNAKSIAESRGITLVEETDSHAPDFDSLVEVNVAGATSVEVAGTTIGDNDRPWLTHALGFNVDIELTEYMALLRYPDVPGMIGRVGTAFGNAGVNIANMAVSRLAGTALMVVSFDVAPPDSVIAELAASPDFDTVTSVAL